MQIDNAEFTHCVGLKSQLPQPGLPEIAFAGRSNVGKSSLINCLLLRKALARTSGQPGKTQTLNFYLVNSKFYLVDLPGYGFAKVPQQVRNRWESLLEDYLSQRESLKGVALVIDSRHAPSPLDLQMFQWLKYYNKPLLIVATKVDKLRSSERRPFIQRLQAAYGSPVLPFSSEKKSGREEIWSKIENIIGD
ncbi:MAG: ribosome biogenesis GTP-binding protein YihA/YsxC [Eubacteriales bacterium]|jgi:GTP-binding protein|nr:ribosome biogenesis GTP-binding protein YihA/YsxC [Eubacteriales bacterium]